MTARLLARRFGRVFPAALGCLAWLALAVSAVARGDEADEDDQPRRLPGLIAEYRNSGLQRKSPSVERYDAVPAFLLGPGETPDPRLNARGWSVNWQGVIEIFQPGKYHFAARSTGGLEMRIDGRPLRLAQLADKPTIPGDEVELSFGLHPIEIFYRAQHDATQGNGLKLFWESEHFGREPLQPHALGHTQKDRPVSDGFSRGRLMVEEHSCTACHRRSASEAPSAGKPARLRLEGEERLSPSLVTRPGPHLTDAGSRLKAGWLYHWLGEPQQLRPEAVMPRLFSADGRGQVERYAVAVLLASRGNPLPAAGDLVEGDKERLAAAGEWVYVRTGCVVCHETNGDRPARATLLALGQKTTPAALAAFLLNPSAVDPAGRMPGFKLTAEEARQLAVYLTTRDERDTADYELPGMPPANEIQQAYLAHQPPAQDVVEWLSWPVPQRLAALGKLVMQSKRCSNCHEMNVPGEAEFWKPQYAQSDFARIAAKRSGGCLAPADAPAGGDVPAFGAALDRPAATAFLAAALVAPGTSAPGEFARLTLERFNCTGCHRRDGTGGLGPDLTARLLPYQTGADAESLSPPSLTGLMGKLLAPALRRVLEENERHRPWMGLQMPRFAHEHVHHLPEGLAALEGETLQTEPYRPPRDASLADAGRRLLGAKGFGCTKCHDMLGIATSGTRGSDLSLVGERIRFDWYLRWMTDPQRLEPGTRMPTVFLNGESPYKDVLAGDPAGQRLAIWHYLVASKDLPPPEGLEPNEVAEVTADQRPALVRTFLPGTTPRGIAIRYPNSVHVAYDAQACRLAYAWTGDFLEMGPVWSGRGGSPAGIRGPIFWTSPAGFPWDVTTAADVAPDFTSRGQDTSLGAELPQDGRLYPTRLHFRGYRTGGPAPAFRYELELGNGRAAWFGESIASLRSELAVGVLRDAVVTAPRGHMVWLHAGSAEQPPRWRSRAGAAGTLDKPSGTAPADRVVTLVQDGKPLLMHLRASSPETVWLAAEQGGKWAVLVRSPISDEPAQARLSLAVWCPARTEPGTLDRVAEAELQETTP